MTAIMQAGGVAKQVARLVALGALFLVPFTPLIVAEGFFFPFITGKAFFFRTLVEIAIAAWVVLALLDAEYRPRFSWLGAAALAFVVWMFVADLFAINVVKAFWSNFERMEGWVFLAHLLGFFFAASNVLRVEKKWRAWFLTSLAVGLVVIVYALLQLSGAAAIHQGSTRIDASFGNSAYLAIYLLFSVFVALWLALTEKQAWLKWSLIALAVVQGILVVFTETRGTVLGLAAALFLAALLTVLTTGKQARVYAVGAAMLLVLLAGSFYLARDSAFVQGHHTLQRVASISLADGQTRFTIWSMALQGVAERPVVGWGQEGFNYVFNKYYDPSLYGQESWFDRAHNVYIDWLTAGGVPAFLLYVALFVSAVVLLWRTAELSRAERIALTAALVGYAIHNLFVFDNLYSYIYFFAILALIDSQVSRPTSLETLPELSESDGAVFALPIAAVVALALVWYVNIANMQTASRLIVALSPSPQGVAGNIQAFQDLLATPSFAAQEIREQLVSFASAVAGEASVTDDEKRQALTLAITEMQKHAEQYPGDARVRLQLSYAYRAAGDLQNALREVLVAAELSPNKQEMLTEAGALAWDLGKTEDTQRYFARAYALNPQAVRLAAYAAAGHFAVGDTAAANKILLDAYGTTVVDDNILAIAYYRTKQWERLAGLWKLRAEKPGASAKTWFSLAAAYYLAGDSASSIATIRKTMALFPDTKAAGTAAIQQIQSGQPLGQ
ncbi:MAG: O-antigen ligase family protein [Candidatus Paceibacterota bacterium]